MLHAFLLIALSLTNVVPASDAPGVRRIVHRTDGVIERGVVRATDTGFELRRENGWIAIQSSAIRVVRDERDVLAELARREAALAADAGRRADLDLRAGLCAWMLDEGLGEEARSALDRALATAPDAPALIAVCARLPIGAGEPGWLGRIASQGSRARREAALAHLAASCERESLRAGLVRQLERGQPALRAFAALGLQRIYAGLEDERLAARAVADPHEHVRTAAVDALAATKSALGCSAIARSLDSASGVARVRAARALGDIGLPVAIEPLVRALARAASSTAGTAPRANVFVGEQTSYVSDFNVEIAQAASIADPIVGVSSTGVVLDAAVLGTSQISARDEARAYGTALRQVTGAKLGDDALAWLKWWNEQQAVPAPATTR